ncbi:MAG TPA: ParB/RepB/Spo0J family partition protein [Candidatus Omnitrophota bacterium]|nr:ParB/RepB/Spo0J family partition protein [Candidatus Omnitrophota bacterium]
MGDSLLNLITEISSLPESDKIQALNAVKQALHDISPFKSEPVDCVVWIPAEQVEANDYNPNTVATPEMKLLQLSISEDGYTQPIVAWGANGYYEVVDGFHRNRVGKECPEIKKRIHGYLPITIVNSDRTDKSDRIAATIRHNRARGKHTVTGMSDIVLELSRRNWSDEKIGRELGMEPDEVLRLKQITGLAELFADKEFSEAWE